VFISHRAYLTPLYPLSHSEQHYPIGFFSLYSFATTEGPVAGSSAQDNKHAVLEKGS
jgi:hypothetical protein